MNTVYETLTVEVQSKVNSTVENAIESLKVNGSLDIDLLMATLEQLNAKKKEIKENTKKRMLEEKAALKKSAAERGKAYVNSLTEKVDYITFVYGNNGSKRATLLLLKKGASTAQVEYTPDMLGPDSHTSIRNVLYSKIVVPEDFIMEV